MWRKQCVLTHGTVRPEINFFVHSKYFSGLTKKEFSVHQLFFGSNTFSTVQIRPDSQKKSWFRKKSLVQKKVSRFKNWHFGFKIGYFCLFCSFWASKHLFTVQRLFWFKHFFIQIRPDSQKRILNRKEGFEPNTFFWKKKCLARKKEKFISGRAVPGFPQCFQGFAKNGISFTFPKACFTNGFQ